MKLSVGTKILIRLGGRMLSTRILLFSPSGRHVLLGARSDDFDCSHIGWRPTSEVSVVERLDQPSAQTPADAVSTSTAISQR